MKHPKESHRDRKYTGGSLGLGIDFQFYRVKTVSRLRTVFRVWGCMVMNRVAMGLHGTEPVCF